MDKEIIFIVEEDTDGGFSARALGHSIFTQADTLSKLKKCIQEAVNCHYESDKKPPIIRLHIVKDEVIPA